MSNTPNNIYFHHDVLAHSLDGHNLDIITITSMDGMLPFHESTLDGLFPLDKTPERRARAFKMSPIHHAPATPSSSHQHRQSTTPKFTPTPDIFGIEFERLHGSPSTHGKHYAFLSARVHPAETISSFMLDGFIEFLVSNDSRAQLLRSLFVFKIVPMLNPDGVVRGHYRGDLRGVNLNRVYVDPDPSTHPTIWATKQYILNGLAPTGSVRWYIDLHGHANKWGCFLFGNWIGDVEKQVAMLSFARCMHMNCGLFDFSACDFAPKGMVDMHTNQHGDLAKPSSLVHDVSHDKPFSSKTGSSMSTLVNSMSSLSIEATKDGTGRVAMYRALGIHHCYTFEANYYGCKSERRAISRHATDLSPNGRSGSPTGSSHASSGSVSSRASTNIESRRFTLSDMRNMGRALGVSILDMEMPSHAWSRLPVAEPLGMAGVQNWAVDRVRRMYERLAKPVNEDQVTQFLRKRDAIVAAGSVTESSRARASR